MCSIWSWFVYIRAWNKPLFDESAVIVIVYILYIFIYFSDSIDLRLLARSVVSQLFVYYFFFFLFITTTVNSIGNICISMSHSIWMSKLLFRRCCTKIVRVLVRSAYYLLLFWLIWFTNIYTNVISRVKLSLLLIVWFLVLPRLK